jgi:peptidoglycan LD-endopeptidase LytH
MSRDVHWKGGLKRVLTTRATRCVSWVMVVALVGSLFVALLSFTSSAVSPAYAAPSDLASIQSDLKKAKAALAKQQASLDKLAAKANKAESQLAVTQNKIASVQTKIQAANKKLSQLAGQLEVRLRDIYMYRSSDTLALINALFNGGGSLDQVMKELSLLSRVAHNDTQLISDVKSNVKDLRSFSADLASEKKQEQKDNANLTKAVNASLQALESSKDTYNTLRAHVRALQLEEAKRQQAIADFNATSTTKPKSGGTTATTKGQTGTTQKGTPTTKGGTATTKGNTPTTKGNTPTTKGSTPTTKPKPPDPPVVGGDFVFPVAGPNSFIDSWGAPRSGGRTHKGCDIMTARDTPLVACVTGSILRTSPVDSGLGGITVWVKGTDGTTYYYAHCSSIKEGIKAGVHVEAGQTIAYAGNTGNAAGGAVHLHFEIHPGGGAAIDPYPTLIKYR